MSCKNNLSFDLGEDWVILLTCNQADGVTPLDVTSADADLALSGVVGLAVTAVATVPLQGILRIRCTPTQQLFAGVEPGVYNYTLRVTLGDGTITDQSFGELTVRKSEF